MDAIRDVVVMDIETASLVDLKDVGAWAYSQDPSTAVYCVVFGVKEGNQPLRTVWRHMGDMELPRYLVRFVREGGTVVAHNVSFEKSIWTNVLVPRFGYPVIEPDQWRDTQAMGLSLNLPPTLAGLAKALAAAKTQKDAGGGASLMREMAKAVVKRGKGSYRYPEAAKWDKMEKLLKYCETDVRATYDCYRAMAPLSIREHRVWLADQRINARGVYLDRKFAANCLKLTDQRQAELDDQAFRLTAAATSSASAPPALKAWLASQNVTLPKQVRVRPDGSREATPTLGADAVAKLLEDDDLPPLARQVLEIRREANKITSLAKLQRVATMTGVDGRLRHALQYQGAHTGRWTSYGLQLHNLPKVKLSRASVDLARTAINLGSLDALKIAEDRPLEVLSQMLRSVIAAPPGREIIAGDFAAIEARVVAWLAQQHDVLHTFEQHDRGELRGGDVYEHEARKIGSDNRQLGKIARLALGYGMGPLKLASTAASWGVTIDLKEAKRICDVWRQQNGYIALFWGLIEEAAWEAVQRRNKRIRFGRLSLVASPQCLMVTLPSGRVLRYWRPSLARVEKTIKIVTDEGEIQEIPFNTTELRYFTVGRDKVTMVQESTYGGKLTENITQAVARDLLAEALLRIDGHWPYEVVIHVHDSLACEVPEGHGDVEEFCWLMAKVPSWAAGLPVAVDGYRDVRFRG